MEKLFFWLNWHAGDLILSRPLVRQIFSEHDVQIAWACLTNQAYLVEDLPVQLFIDPRDDQSELATRPDLTYLSPPDHLPIHLWVGKYEDTKFHQWGVMVELYNRQVTAAGRQHLRISDKFVPMVDFPPLDVEIANSSIFLENGRTRAKHSSFEFDVPFLASTFPQFNFYCTANPNCTVSNVADCSRMNLRELSSISNHCIAIIGKGSGPFCSTLNEQNRFKPRALMQYHPSGWEQTIWDFPGNPTHYLETSDELLRFLKEVELRQGDTLRIGKVGSMADEPRPSTKTDYQATNIQVLLGQFRRNPNDPDFIEAVLEARDQVVRYWLDIDESKLEYAYRSLWGKIERELIRLCVQELRGRGAATDLARLPKVPHVEHDDDSIYSADVLRWILVGMITVQPQDFPFPIDFRRLPDWLRSDFLDYLPMVPVHFTKRGQSDRYFRFQERALGSFADTLTHEPERTHHSYWSRRWILRLRRQRYLLTDASLKDSQRAHAVVVEHMLRSYDYELDFAFSASTRDRKPRVGFLLNRLGESLDTLALLAYFEHLRDDYQTFLYVINSKDNSLVEYCSHKVDEFRLLPSDLKDQVDHIRKDDLDVLISACDTSVEEKADWLSLFRLARRQVAVNSPVTSGASSIDYFLSGTHVESNAYPSQSYTEDVINMEGSGLCWSTGNYGFSGQQRITRESLGLPSDARVFGSFACVLDIAPELLAAWANILNRVPDSILYMMPFDNSRCGMYDQQAYFDFVCSVLSDFHVDPNRLRMIVLPSFPKFEDMGKYTRLVDIYLDGFYVNSLVPALSALREGVPVITRRATERRSNLVAALIEELSPDLTDFLVGQSQESYIDKATRLGNDDSLRQKLLARIQQAIPTAPFFDTKLFARRFARHLQIIVRAARGEGL